MPEPIDRSAPPQVPPITRGMMTAIAPLRAGLLCRCPRCGIGRLFTGLLDVREGCGHCGLSYTFADAGDGPAVFVILFEGALVCGLALWTEVNFSPPLWLHGVLWTAMIGGVSFFLLPRLKAFLIALQYRTNARLGHVDRPADT